jgi:hypothetical protein
MGPSSISYTFAARLCRSRVLVRNGLDLPSKSLEELAAPIDILLITLHPAVGAGDGHIHQIDKMIFDFSPIGVVEAEVVDVDGQMTRRLAPPSR